MHFSKRVQHLTGGPSDQNSNLSPDANTSVYAVAARVASGGAIPSAQTCHFSVEFLQRLLITCTFAVEAYVPFIEPTVLGEHFETMDAKLVA